ncbi:MAG: amino acid ABC transporter substrate-binding protein [Burkholderiales bacterium]|jgi:polar amino acid transport system substrate-binding protein|nr:amino acid ABC transporter substrate-binding protein [Burkholderiales bacterium]
MKKWLLIPAFLFAVGITAGCSKQEPVPPKAPEAAPAATQEAPAAAPAPVAARKLVIGLDDSFPPMGFRDEKGEIVGFDIDLAREAAKRMGAEAEFKAIDWKAKEAELMSKRIDLLWNGLTITEERKQNINFTSPYMENHQIIVVVADSPIKTKADLKDKIVGVQEGSSAISAIEKEPDVQKSFSALNKYDDNVKALTDLSLGRLNAVVLDEVVGRYYVAKQPGKYLVLDDHFGAEEYGVGLRKDDTALLDELNKALDAMKADGAAAGIAQTWFGKDVIKR